MDKQTYRDLMRSQAGAVALIATGAVGTRRGLTATAVCSLTDEPPTLLVCVNQSASAHDEIGRQGCFSVNLLSTEHQDLAGVFSGRTELQGEARFDDALWQTLKTGAPILKRALASFDCEVTEQRKVATHSIFVGEVRDGRVGAQASPLIYFQGGFCELHNPGDD